MTRVVGWLVKRWRPIGGWGIFTLALVAILCLPASVFLVVSRLRVASILQAWSGALQGLFLLTIGGALLGLYVARRPVSGLRAAATSLLSGLALALLVVGGIVPHWELLWSHIQPAPALSTAAPQSIFGLPSPFAPLGATMVVQLAQLSARVMWDAHSITGGGSLWATSTSVLLAGLLLWVVAFWANWQIYRRHTPLVALLPSGALVAVLAYRHAPITYYLFMFLACTLCLAAACRLWANREAWESAHTDHPGQMGLDLALAVAPWILVLLLLAGVLPTRGFRTVSRAFWGQTETAFDPFDVQTGSEDPGTGSLPQAHLLDSGPRHLDSVVMYVRTNDPPPVQPEPGGHAATDQRRYWRGDTFDIYTGRGWLSSALFSTEVPAKALLDESWHQGTDLLQHYELQTDTEFVYAANRPHQVDRDVRAWWRGPGDLGRLTSDAESYHVISRPAEARIPDLKTSQESTPDWVMARYLALPEGVPPRVGDLAEQVTQNAESRYDKALAIETFLRSYTYNLELPVPPMERDLVDYFLFELQEGYCDYYASAMVVMARSVGVPARLAMGFAQGEYQHSHDRWVVKEQDAHSWVEVYFAGVGWVEFEPTAGRTALSRAGEDEGTRPEVPGLPVRSAPWQKLLSSASLAVLIVAALGVTAYAGIRLAGRRAQKSSEVVHDRYERMLRWGERLGAPLQAGQTPQEFASALADRLGAGERRSDWPRTRRARQNARKAVKELVRSYVHARYGTKPLLTTQVEAIRLLWPRLSRDLLWLWFFRPRD